MSQITNQTKYGQIQYTSISKNVNQYKSNDIVQKYNNKYHNTIKMKPVDIIYIYIYIYIYIQEIVRTFMIKNYEKQTRRV